MIPAVYPLQWPEGKARSRSRVPGTFKDGGSSITVPAAIGRVEAQLNHLGAKSPMVSSNLQPTLSGVTRGRGETLDPGVVVFFDLKDQAYAMACDRYTTVASNLAAIAAHLDATRGIERWGVASAAESLQVFLALPGADGGGKAVGRPWWSVLELEKSASRTDVLNAYRRLAAVRHPDVEGGSHEAMAELNAARDAALASFG